MTTLTKFCLAMVAVTGLVVAGVSASYAVGDPQQGDDLGGFVPVPATNQNKVTERGITGKPPVKPRPIADGAIIIGAPPEQGQKPLGLDPSAFDSSIPPKASSKNWDLKLRSPLVKKIEAALEQPTEVSFTDNPLEEALNYLEDVHHIEIWMDRQALVSDGVAPDQQVTLVITGVALKSGLSMILEPLNLDYIIKNEVLVITTADKANEHFETRVYDVSRLKDVTPAELDQIIRSTIAPDTWAPIPTSEHAAAARRPSGAPGSGIIAGGGPRQANLRSTNTSLVIRQTQRLHEEIVDLLNQLDEVAAGAATPTPGSTPTSLTPY
jgi:hypothetical protein